MQIPSRATEGNVIVIGIVVAGEKHCAGRKQRWQRLNEPALRLDLPIPNSQGISRRRKAQRYLYRPPDASTAAALSGRLTYGEFHHRGCN